MDGSNFDRIVRGLAITGSRREALKRLGIGTIAGVFGVRAVDAAAKGGRRSSGNKTLGQGSDKVTICHRTGSEKNPFVTITVSKNALLAHTEHGDAEGACKPDGESCDGDNACESGCCTNKVCGCPAPTCQTECYDDEGKCSSCDSPECKTGNCELTCPPECPETCKDGKCPPEQCPGGCPPNSTCRENECDCDEGYVPGPDNTCVQPDTDQCPGACFYIRDRDACFSCPTGSKATSRGTCRCQYKARRCKKKFGGKVVQPVRCENR